MWVSRDFETEFLGAFLFIELGKGKKKTKENRLIAKHL